MAGTRVVLTANSQATLSEDDLQCPICVSLLKEPKSLQCGHSFCADCLKDYCRSSEYRSVIKCPVCRHDTYCISTVDRLPTNYAVLACIEKIEAVTRKPQSFSDVLQHTNGCNSNSMEVDVADDASERVQTAAQHFSAPRRKPYLVSCTEIAGISELRLPNDRQEPKITCVCIDEFLQLILLVDHANGMVKSIKCDLLTAKPKSVNSSASTKPRTKDETKLSPESSVPRTSCVAGLRCELRCAVGAPCAVRVLDAQRLALVECSRNLHNRQLVFYSRQARLSDQSQPNAYVALNSVFLSGGTSPYAFIELTYNAHLLVAFEDNCTVYEFDSRVHKVAHLDVSGDCQASTLSQSQSAAAADIDRDWLQWQLVRRCVMPSEFSSISVNRELDLITVTSCSRAPDSGDANACVRLFDRDFVQLLRIDAGAAPSSLASTSTSTSTATTTSNWRPTRALLNTDSFLFVYNDTRNAIDCYELETFEYSHVLIDHVHVTAWCLNANDTTLIIFDGSSKRALFAYSLKYSLSKASKKGATSKVADDGKTARSRRCILM